MAAEMQKPPPDPPWTAQDDSIPPTLEEDRAELLRKLAERIHVSAEAIESLREVFAKELEVRLRPGYFPFVEPGFELDVRCPFCESGCSVCKRSTWIELCPCGMVHPKVLRYGGVDSERFTGFAFGLGLSRLVMLRYGIDDIRHLMGADLRFLEQF